MSTKNKRDLVSIDLDIAAAARRHAKHQDLVSKKSNEVTMNLLLDERFQMSPVPTDQCKSRKENAKQTEGTCQSMT